MKKLCLIVLTLIMSLSLCLGLTACIDKTVKQLENEFGVFLEGGKFEYGSILNFDNVDSVSEKAEELFEQLSDIGVEITDKTKAFIYDIFVTKDGKEVQPNGKVKLTIPMSQEGAENGYTVYHIKDNGEIERITATYEDGKLSFETDGFSYYIFAMNDYINETGWSRFKYRLTITVEPAQGGYIEIEGEETDASNGVLLYAGECYTLTAVANEDWLFAGWYDADFNEMLAEDDVYDVYMNNNHKLIAMFEEIPNQLIVTVVNLY